jgi:hypothetical protein
MVQNHHAVIPAKAGIQFIKQSPRITSDFAGDFCQLSRVVPSADKAIFAVLSHRVGIF